MECLFCHDVLNLEYFIYSYSCKKCHVVFFINNNIHCISYQKNDKYDLDYYTEDKNFDLVEKKYWTSIFTSSEILEINEITLDKLEFYLRKFLNLKVFI